jgi:hypothetical protein
MSKTKRISVYGKKVEKIKGEYSVSESNDHQLDINEVATTIRMPDTTVGPYGVPISTGAAVLLIKNYKEVLKEEKIDFTSESANKSRIEDLLVTLQGITFDKSQILRIISQPGCEGMRFYPAVRKNSSGDFDSFTLVCVGVNENGFDLNYEEYKKENVFTKGADSCESIVDDWGHPPTISKDKLLSAKMGDEHYVLMRLAEEA